MLTQLASLVRVDFAPQHRQPPAARVVLATIASIAGSLAADALLVVIGEAIFPGTKGFVHFRFSDYAKLTVVGVIIACVAWPIVTRISSAPRWLFFRLAILVTLVLWLPDLYLLYKGESADAVAVLMVMHLAIAVVTYNLLVHVAPVRPPAGRPARGSAARGRATQGRAAHGRAAHGPAARGSAERGPAYGERSTRPAPQQSSRGQHRHAR
jgi:hypothetical protein